MDASPSFRRFFFGQRLNSIGIPFLVGMLLFVLLPVVLFFALMLVAALCLLLFSVISREKESRRVLLFAAAGISFSLVFAGILQIKELRLQRFEGETLSVCGTVTAFTEDGFDLYAKSPFCGKVRVKSEKVPSYGERGRIDLRLYPTDGTQARTEGVDLAAFAEGEWQKEGVSAVRAAIGFIRDRASEAFGSGREGGFMRAILLGDRSELSELDKQAFRRTSSSHLLAISGLHVSHFLGVFRSVVHWLPVKRRLRNFAMLPILLIIFLVTGSSVSVFRAVVMASFPLIGECFKRRSDSVTALVLAACLLVIWEPYSILSPSFLLSFFATLGILTVAAPLGEAFYFAFSEIRGIHHGFKTFSSFLVQSLLVSSVTFVFTFPFQLLLFGTVSPFSPLYAIFLIPLFSPCLVASLAAAFCGICGLFADSSASVARGICGLFLRFHSFVAEGSPPLLDLEYFAPIPAFAVAGILLFLVIGRKKLVCVLYLHAVLLAASLILFPIL